MVNGVSPLYLDDLICQHRPFHLCFSKQAVCGTKLKKTTAKNSFQTFLSDTCQEINVRIKGKNSNNFRIKLNEDD